MKKLVFLAIAFCSINTLNAQAPSPSDSLKEYAGKYKFPEGSPFPEVIIIFENGTLTASSAAGSSEIKRRAQDTFDVVGYGGIAIFKRNEEKKIIKLQVQVNEIDIEGEKTENLGLGSGIILRYRRAAFVIKKEG